MPAVRWWLAACGLLACGSFACSAAPSPPPAPPPSALPAALPPSVAPPPQPVRRADVAEPPLETESAWSAGEWEERHAALLRAPGRKGAELIVLGDTIAEAWASSRAFQKQWRKQRPLNLALAGDQSQQLLWRIEHGALQGLSPRLVIVSVGSENLAHGFSPEETARGVAAVLTRVREQLPSSRVLVLGLLPAGQSPADPRRAPIAATNARLQALSEGQVLVTDAGGVFLDADGSMTANVTSDFVHPTALGYEALTMSVSFVAQRLLEGRLH